MSVIARTVPNRLNGIPFMDKTGVITSGQIFWVHSGTGSDGNHRGLNPHQPFATIDYAIGNCTANKGDVIYVMPGHAETLAAAGAITVDVAGVSIIGLGNGTNRPMLTYSATTSTLLVTALDVLIRGIQFTSAINNLAAFVVDSACNFTIEDCVFTTASTLEAYCFINITTTYDNIVIRRCEFYQPTDPQGTSAAADTGAIFLVDSQNVLIEDCKFVGYFETAFVHNRTTAASDLWIKRCTGQQLLSDGLAVVMVALSTGGMIDSLFQVVAATAAVEATFFTLSVTFFLLNCGVGNDGSGTGKLSYAGSTVIS